MGTRAAVFFVVTPLLLISAANGQAIRQALFTNAAKDVPCRIEDIYEKHQRAATAEAEAFNRKKEEELVDPVNRADRGYNRTKKGEEVSVEGGMSHHRLSLDLPQITVRTSRKSFDLFESYWSETRIPLTEKYTCWFKTGWLKTKVWCFRKKDMVTKVPQFRRRTVIFDLPSAVETKMQRVDFSYDLPTVTQRDNRKELEHAQADVDRIRKEIEQGKSAITARHDAEFVAEVNATFDKAEAEALARIEQMQADALAPVAQKRAELASAQANARSAAGDRAGEVDASFAQAFKAIDETEALIRNGFDGARRDVAKQFADLRSDFEKTKTVARACGAKL